MCHLYQLITQQKAMRRLLGLFTDETAYLSLLSLLKALTTLWMTCVDAPAFAQAYNVNNTGNLVRNGNFERAGTGVPKNWSSDCPTGSVTKSTTDRKWDANSLLLIDPSTSQTCGAYSSGFPVTPGKTYKVEAHAKWKVLSGATSPVIYTNFYDQAGNELQSTGLKVPGSAGTYNKFHTEVVAPPTAASARVILYSIRAAALEINFDGIAFYEKPAIANEAVYYVAPAAVGSGSGSDPSNYAKFNDPQFWAAQVRNALSKRPVRVILAEGEYTVSNPTDQLRISGLGHSSNRLSIEGQDGFGTVLRVVPNASSSSVASLVIDNSRNIVLRNVHFRANPSVNLYYFLNIANGSSNITVAGVSAIDAKDIKFGVFGPSQSTNIIFRENEIQRAGTTDGHHGIYGFKGVSGLTVENNVFEDITGSHVRCRSKCQTITVNNNEFMATGGSWSSNSAYKWPFFIELAVYNDQLWNGSNPQQQEWFIGGVVATGNSFTYAGSPTGTRNVPFHIGASGYEPWDGTAFREHLISDAEALILRTGTCDQKREFINNKFSIELGTEFSVLNNSFSGQRRLAQLGSYARYGAADHYSRSEYEGGNQSFDLSSCLQ
jgi:hypothetical protein